MWTILANQPLIAKYQVKFARNNSIILPVIFLSFRISTMAKISVELIQVIRKTAETIAKSPIYQWGHMGACNCGFLAQQITQLKKNEIHTRAMQGYGDWTEQLNDYCPTSGMPMDNLISEMVAFGFDTDDLKNLERLSDKRVLATLPFPDQGLLYNVKSDVAIYLKSWADLLENELIDQITLPDLTIRKSIL